MKIIISSNSAWNVVNFRNGVVMGLISNGFKVIVVSPEDEYVSKLCSFGCAHIRANIDNSGINPIKDIYLIFQYIKIFLKEKPDIVLTYTIKPNIYGSIAADIISIPIVNNISGLGTSFIRGGWLGKVVSFLYRISLKKSKCVFFQNNDDKDLFLSKNLVTKSQVDILPGSGVDLEYYQPSNSNISKKYKDEFVFLLIARLIWDKGIKEYIDAARYIRNSNINIRFQILGFLDVDNQTAVSRFYLDSWVKEGIVQYLGEADDVRLFIKHSDCVVLPSYREGLPKTLLEASAMGKPIITTNVEGCREVVDDGINGYLCNVRDADDLAKKMKIILSMDYKDVVKMGLEGRKKMEIKFDEKIVIDKYMSIVCQITHYK